jgi:hypothetical protein
MVISFGIYLFAQFIGDLPDHRKTTAESRIIANAKKPSAATEKLYRFLPHGCIRGGLSLFVLIMPQSSALVYGLPVPQD